MRTLAAILVAAVIVATPAHGAASCRWRVVLDRPGPELDGVAAVSSRDVWAVGDDGLRPTILHWDGRRWRSVASRVFAFDVAAASANDVWAVGSSALGPGASPRAEHWDGRRWRAVRVPGAAGEYLRAVAAVSRRDVWAVGANERGQLIEHWDGRAWHRIGGGPVDGLLHGIDALSAGVIWAVGTQGMQTPGPRSEDALIERWDGSRWRTQPVVRLDWVNDNMFGVDAVSPRNVWAVGSIDANGGYPVVQRWDGRAWSWVPTGGLPRARVTLSAVAVLSREDVWVVGSSGFGSGERPVIAHWQRGRWSALQGFLPRGGLNAVAALTRRDIWAAGGSQRAAGKSRSLVERYSCS